jgi:1-deoxy-D-xylulose-5-phosphate synthase
MVQEALTARNLLHSKNIHATVVNCRFIKPLDEKLLLELAQQIPDIITLEENALQGGFGSAVLELLTGHQVFPHRFHRVGLPDQFIEHGAVAKLRQKFGLNAEAIVDIAMDMAVAKEPAGRLNALASRA